MGPFGYGSAVLIGLLFLAKCELQNSTTNDTVADNPPKMGNESNPKSTSTVASTTPSTQQANITDNATTTSELDIYGDHLSVDGILGCIWPDDVIKRFQFCVEASNLSKVLHDAQESDKLFYGLLNKKIMKSLIHECKESHCKTSINEVELNNVVNWWIENKEAIIGFRKCLQKNTEGMVRLCGVGTKLSTVISGIVGLHVNVIDAVLPAMEKEKSSKSECLQRIMESAHLTSAIYLGSNFYRENSVFCWDVTQGTCKPICRQFAQILQCMSSKCPNSKGFIEKIGIWQWYFLNPRMTAKTCNLTNEITCKNYKLHTGEGPLFISTSNIKHLFSAIGEKLVAFKEEVEAQLHMPFYLVSMSVLSAFAILILLTALICMWRHGLIMKQKRKDLRYSRIIPGRNLRSKEETRALTVEDDEF
uniref:Chondroitin proteoglycan 4 domain-containing protein n=1 Tax=Trichuris muris TaxID=70415 RepID=A0A5S6QGZ9_TRIMR